MIHSCSAAALHFLLQSQFLLQRGIWHKPQHDVWYTMKLKEPVYQENGCVPNTYGTFQDPLVFPIHTRNIRPIGQIFGTIPSPWIQPLRKGMSDMPWMIQRATVPGKWLRPNRVRYIARPTGSVLSIYLYIYMQLSSLLIHVYLSYIYTVDLVCTSIFVDAVLYVLCSVLENCSTAHL